MLMNYLKRFRFDDHKITWNLSADRLGLALFCLDQELNGLLAMVTTIFLSILRNSSIAGLQSFQQQQNNKSDGRHVG